MGRAVGNFLRGFMAPWNPMMWLPGVVIELPVVEGAHVCLQLSQVAFRRIANDVSFLVEHKNTNRGLSDELKGDVDTADSVYAGIDPITPDEVADCVMFALTRPAHVNVDELVIKTLRQSSGARVVRREE